MSHSYIGLHTWYTMFSPRATVILTLTMFIMRINGKPYHICNMMSKHMLRYAKLSISLQIMSLFIGNLSFNLLTRNALPKEDELHF